MRRNSTRYGPGEKNGSGELVDFKALLPPRSRQIAPDKTLTKNKYTRGGRKAR